MKSIYLQCSDSVSSKYYLHYNSYYDTYFVGTVKMIVFSNCVSQRGVLELTINSEFIYFTYL